MMEVTHASSLPKERTVPSTEVLSETGPKPMKAWYTAIAALCQNETMFFRE